MGTSPRVSVRKPPSELLINDGLAASFAVLCACFCACVCVNERGGEQCMLLHGAHMGTAVR